jgi:hypothetical protein
MAASVSHPFAREVELFHQPGGVLRMSDALRFGISRRTLYAMRDRHGRRAGSAAAVA